MAKVYCVSVFVPLLEAPESGMITRHSMRLDGGKIILQGKSSLVFISYLNCSIRACNNCLHIVRLSVTSYSMLFSRVLYYELLLLL